LYLEFSKSEYNFLVKINVSFIVHVQKNILIWRATFARCKILTNIMPPHVKMSIKHDMGKLFLNSYMTSWSFALLTNERFIDWV